MSHHSTPAFKSPSRSNLPTSKYNVYLDGYPEDNPPVLISDLPWTCFIQNRNIFDKYSEGLKVFGSASYPPPTFEDGTPGTFGHLVIQFDEPSDARRFFRSISDGLFFATKLNVNYFGDRDHQFKSVYSYPGKIPFMGGKKNEIAHVSYKKQRNEPPKRDVKTKPDLSKNLRKEDLRDKRDTKKKDIIEGNRSTEAYDPQKPQITNGNDSEITKSGRSMSARALSSTGFGKSAIKRDDDDDMLTTITITLPPKAKMETEVPPHTLATKNLIKDDEIAEYDSDEDIGINDNLFIHEEDIPLNVLNPQSQNEKTEHVDKMKD
jgi:hypothetical protein